MEAREGRDMNSVANVSLRDRGAWTYSTQDDVAVEVDREDVVVAGSGVKSMSSKRTSGSTLAYGG
jgi:hypothetical protein